MSALPATPWHKASYDRLLFDSLPQLLAERLPLGGYRVEPDGPRACRVTVTLSPEAGEAEAVYPLPMPDARGLFERDGRLYVMVPVASSDELDTAEIRCAGEQLFEFIAERLGHAPVDPDWQEEDLRDWLPLEEWTREYMNRAQPLDTTNRLSEITHLRRILLPERRRMFTPGHRGRVCPIETPEGPNVGKVLTVARGAEIREGRLVITDPRPEAGLSVAASAIPFLENSDSCRLVMAANMMRQWLSPPDHEPALIQTGQEPDDPAFWCGCNLLTAYVAWGCDTYEDSIVVSESCARRLGYPAPLQCGDKLSNRSGNKGVISRILPDAEMPHLEDGTPVELAFSALGLYSRLTIGQLREAALSWEARQAGRPIRVPPFHAPTPEALRARLKQAGLPESGMRALRSGQDGDVLPLPATVGWVYWGKLAHTAGGKMHTALTPEARGQRVGEAEFHALRLAGAHEIARELFHTLAVENSGAETLAERVTAGPVAQSAPPSPPFAALQARLAAAGIRAEIRGETIAYSLAPIEGEKLTLAVPLSHPWLPQARLTEVGAMPQMREYRALAAANDRLARMQAHHAPESLTRPALADLQAWAQAFFQALVTPETLEFSARALFTARAVAAPGCGLRFDQVGLPEEIAWSLFAPGLTREMGDDGPIQARTAQAAQALDALMARSWVLIHRPPTYSPASFLAFHPVRTANPVLRLHPMACMFLNADFDGDQLYVFLPVTESGQREAGEKLTIAAHIRRDRGVTRSTRPLYDAQFGPLLRLVRPNQDARFGLAWLARTPEGHTEIERLAGALAPLEDGVLTAGSIFATQDAMLAREGVEGMLEVMERLWARGFEAAKASGASLTPFPAVAIEPPAPPVEDDPEAWNAYVEEHTARVMARYADPTTNNDPAKLTLKSGARGTTRTWMKIVGAHGVVTGPDGSLVPLKHGYAEGLTAEEVFTHCIGMREGLWRAVNDWYEIVREMMTSEPAGGYGVLARAMRARKPGIVFARAAAAQETDPLDSAQARLFVGLPAS